MATATRPITLDEFLGLPDDGVERWVIAGELRERPMTQRNRFHSRTLVRLARFLDAWLDGRPEPRGQVLAGEAGVILSHDPFSTVGVDVAYIGPDVMSRLAKDLP